MSSILFSFTSLSLISPKGIIKHGRESNILLVCEYLIFKTAVLQCSC